MLLLSTMSGKTVVASTRLVKFDVESRSKDAEG